MYTTLHYTNVHYTTLMHTILHYTCTNVHYTILVYTILYQDDDESFRCRVRLAYLVSVSYRLQTQTYDACACADSVAWCVKCNCAKSTGIGGCAKNCTAIPVLKCMGCVRRGKWQDEHVRRELCGTWNRIPVEAKEGESERAGEYSRLVQLVCLEHEDYIDEKLLQFEEKVGGGLPY